MGAAGYGHKSVGGSFSRAKSARRLKIRHHISGNFNFECPRQFLTQEKSPFRGSKNCSAHRTTIDDFADVDGELAVSIQEFLRAVERVNQKKTPADFTDPAMGHLFFRNDRHARKLPVQ